MLASTWRLTPPTILLKENRPSSLEESVPMGLAHRHTYYLCLNQAFCSGFCQKLWDKIWNKKSGFVASFLVCVVLAFRVPGDEASVVLGYGSHCEQLFFRYWPVQLEPILRGRTCLSQTPWMVGGKYQGWGDEKSASKIFAFFLFRCSGVARKWDCPQHPACRCQCPVPEEPCYQPVLQGWHINICADMS